MIYLALRLCSVSGSQKQEVTGENFEATETQTERGRDPNKAFQEYTFPIA